MRTVQLELSDVDRGVYDAIELRVAQHPSESLRYMWTRIMAYALHDQPGIAFSKGGLSNADEPSVSVRELDGSFLWWIDVGAPSAERLHKASKAADNVALYSAVRLEQLRREASRRHVHRLEDIDVWPLDGKLLDELGERTSRSMELTVVRTDGQLYVTLDGATFEASIERQRLTMP